MPNLLLPHPSRRTCRLGHTNVLTAAIIAWLAIAPGAQAQSPTTDTPDTPPTETVELEQVKVYGVRKRMDNLQEVPQSVSVLSAELVRDGRVRSIEQLQAYVPNFRVNTSGGRGGPGAISIRGLSNSDFSKDPSVGVYIDDVPFNDLSVYSSLLFDVESIEVLRGPQSTLYGANTPAGVINITTGLPDLEYSGEAELEYGSGDSLLARARIEGALGASGQLSGSLALIHEASDGFLTNRFNDSHYDTRRTDAVRAKLRWQPSLDWDVNLLLQHARIDDSGGPYHYVPLDSQAYSAMFPSAPVLGRHDVWHNRTDGEVGGRENVASLRITRSGESSQFTSITAMRERDEYFSNWDTDSSAEPYDVSALLGMPPGSYLIPGVVGHYDGTYRQVNQEFRLQSPSSGSDDLVWLTGAYFSRSSDDGKGSIAVDGLDMVLQAADLYQEERTWAVFGQATRRFAEGRYGVTAGLRYETVDREGRNDEIPGLTGSVKSSQALPRLGFDMRVSDALLVYLDLSRGWKAGGIAVEAPAGLPFLFDREVVTSAELGMKSSWLADRISLNVAVFELRADDYQDTVRVDLLRRYLSNVEQVRNRGMEIEAQWRPSSGVEVGATFGYVDARYHRYENEDGTNFNGNRVSLIPKSSIGIFGTWRLDNGLFMRADATRNSDYYFDRDNTQRQPGYTMVNAKIGYETGAWEIFAFGENLADAHYYERTFAGTLYPMLQFGSPEKPRRYGIGIRYQF